MSLVPECDLCSISGLFLTAVRARVCFSMRGDSVLVLLNFCVWLRASAAEVCAPCSQRACPPLPAHGCEEGRVLARDPCGCCDQCARLEMELCGGDSWQLGYCALGLTCTALNHTGALTIPDIGVCKGECEKNKTLSFICVIIRPLKHNYIHNYPVAYMDGLSWTAQAIGYLFLHLWVMCLKGMIILTTS